MSTALSANLESKNYTLCISSADKLSGTNNNGLYDINYQDFLPKNIDNFKVGFAFQSGGGQYKDLSATVGYNIKQINGDQISLTTTSAGVLGVGSLITGSAPITATFNGTISGNLLTQIGATSAGNVCVPMTLTGSGNSTVSFNGSVGAGTTTLTVTATAGIILLNMSLTGTGIIGNPTIISQLTGSTGSIGTYQVSSVQNFASTTVTGTLAYNLAGTTITGLNSGSISTTTAVYILSNNFSNNINNQVSISGTTSLADLTTIPTYITSGTPILTTQALGQSRIFTISRSIPLQTPSTITIPGVGSPQIYSGVKINWFNNCRNYSFDASTKSQAYLLGYASRDIQTGTSASNSFSTFYLQYPPKTINKPIYDLTTISLININNGFPLVDTDSVGNIKTDCTPWNLILEFTPIMKS